MGNKYKGTFEAKIGDDTYTLRPSFDACIEFEEKAGISVSEAYELMSKNKSSFKIIGAAIWAGILGEGMAKNNPSYCPGFSVIGEKIKRNGLAVSAVVAIQFLTYALLPDETLEEIMSKKEDGDEDGKK